MKKRKQLFILMTITGLSLFLIGTLLRPSDELVKPIISPVVDVIYALGTVEAIRDFQLRFGMNSTILNLYVEEGDHVNKGDPLLRNDTLLIFTAPFTGVVSEIKYKQGELVPANVAVLTLTSLENMYVRVSLSQESILPVKPGQPVQISFENLRNKIVTGRVARVYPSDGNFIVKIRADQMPEEVVPEMSFDVSIEFGRKDRAVLVTVAAIVNNKLYLWA
jgi:multidrug efflux pump subunit AcrA (membrane-fusion protein)